MARGRGRGRKRKESSGNTRPPRPPKKRVGQATTSNKSNYTRILQKYKLNLDPDHELKWVDNIPQCPVFHPSMEEFQDPLVYLQRIAPQASLYGICKIVCPWKASVPASDVLMKEQNVFQFTTFIQELRFHEWTEKDKATFKKSERTYNFESFEKMANEVFAKRFPAGAAATSSSSSSSSSSSTASHSSDPVYLEKEFWREMAGNNNAKVEYGVNVLGSAFSSNPNDELGQSNGNLQKLAELPDCPLRMLGYQIPGITTPMLYIGMLFSIFAWHVEDQFLYSINYHHCGAPKTWYGVPAHYATYFNRVAQDMVYTDELLLTMGAHPAAALLAQKTTMFPPNLLHLRQVSVYKTVQMPGEYVVTFPRAYHAGFSHGFNCGEAVNFAIGDWFPYGAAAGHVYAEVCKPLALPLDELLCREAFTLSQSSTYNSSTESYSQYCVKISFLDRVQFIDNAVLEFINDHKAKLGHSPASQGTIVCKSCERDCYFAFLECDSCDHSMCFQHEHASLDCSKCSGKLIVYVREDIRSVVDAFEKLLPPKPEQGSSEQQDVVEPQEKFPQPEQQGVADAADEKLEQGSSEQQDDVDAADEKLPQPEQQDVADAADEKLEQGSLEQQDVVDAGEKLSQPTLEHLLETHIKLSPAELEQKRIEFEARIKACIKALKLDNENSEEQVKQPYRLISLPNTYPKEIAIPPSFPKDSKGPRSPRNRRILHETQIGQTIFGCLFSGLKAGDLQ